METMATRMVRDSGWSPPVNQYKQWSVPTGVPIHPNFQQPHQPIYNRPTGNAQGYMQRTNWHSNNYTGNSNRGGWNNQRATRPWSNSYQQQRPQGQWNNNRPNNFQNSNSNYRPRQPTPGPNRYGTRQLQNPYQKEYNSYSRPSNNNQHNTRSDNNNRNSGPNQQNVNYINEDDSSEEESEQVHSVIIDNRYLN
jgi:hypothetical protein